MKDLTLTEKRKLHVWFREIHMALLDLHHNGRIDRREREQLQRARDGLRELIGEHDDD